MIIQSSRKLICVLVIYNTDVYQLEVIRNFDIKFKSVFDIYVHDNSDSEVIYSKNSDIINEFFGIRYYRSVENVGTSGAYINASNYAVRNGYEYMIFLDQDTVLSDMYLQDLKAIISGEVKGDCFIPAVVSHGKLISPSRLDFMGRFVPNYCRAGQMVQTAIASGVIIRSEFFVRIPIPPAELWLDFYDHWLFRELHKRGARCVSLVSTLQHDLSVQNYSSISDFRIRSILAAERKFYSECTFFIKVFSEVKIFVRLIRYFGLRGILRFVGR